MNKCDFCEYSKPKLFGEGNKCTWNIFKSVFKESACTKADIEMKKSLKKENKK